MSTEGASWRLNLDVLDAEMNKITGFPQIEGRFGGRVHFLLGANSDYVRPEHRDRVVTLFPNASHEIIAGAGHWLHAEKPREFVEAVDRFLLSAGS